MENTGKTEDVEKTEGKQKGGPDGLLTELGGCGLFQIILTTAIFISFIPNTFSTQIMSVVMYNPGYKCLESNLTFVNDSQATNGSCSSDWERNDCSCFDSCENIEFNPKTKTGRSEWNLVCNRDSILKTSITISRAGGLIANFVVGYVGDRYGRKTPLIVTKTLVSVLNVAIAFSPSWEVHAFLLFLLDFFQSFYHLLFVLAMEYIPSDWRIKMYAFPTQAIFTEIFAAIAMYTEDWKTLRIIAGVTGLICVIPLLWMPKSLRWLSVNGQKEEAHNVATRIAKLNKVTPPTKDQLAILLVEKKKEPVKIKANTTVFDLFRMGYRLPTLAFAFISFALSFFIAVLALGISSLPGNIYTNIMIQNVGDFPANMLTYVFANRFRRKPTIFMFMTSIAVCFFGVVVLSNVASGDNQRWLMITVVMVARMFLLNVWVFLTIVRMEVYPTVARSTVTAFCAFSGVVGGMAAPHAIPKTPNTIWISFLAMAILAVVCAGIVMAIPETKDKPLKDRWDTTNTSLRQSFISKKSQKSKTIENDKKELFNTTLTSNSTGVNGHCSHKIWKNHN